jgi:hypothetical protein
MTLGQLESMIKEALAFTDAEGRYEVRRNGVRGYSSTDEHFELRGAHLEDRKIVVNGDESKRKILVLDMVLGFDHIREL